MRMDRIMCNVNEGEKYQVIVVGGGPAGCAAAIASAREGKSTLLIEATSALGGMSTMGLVPFWCPFSDGKQLVYRGIAEKIFKRSTEYVANNPEGKLNWVSIYPEALKRIFDDEVAQAGARILFQTQVGSVVVEDRSIKGILAVNKAGLTLYQADVYIDATGDGDVAAGAGAEFLKGRADGSLQSATHCFAIANVDTYGYEHVLGRRMKNGDALRAEGEETRICTLLKDDPELDLITDEHFCNAMYAPGAVGFNAGHLEEVDGTDPAAVSQALIKGRRIAHQFEEGLKKHAPEAFGNAWLSLTGPLLGIRESRRIVCDHNLTVEDYLERRSFEDEIGRSRYYIDVHFTNEELANGTAFTYEKYGYGESHGIPYGSLIPRGIDNLLVAGRCIGSDSMVNGAIRVMPTCMVTGEAAGTAAAMAVECEGRTRDIDVDKLQSRLEEYGAYLHLDK